MRVDVRANNGGKIRGDSIGEREWAMSQRVAPYLDRCTVDTPLNVVKSVWSHVNSSRYSIDKVIDFGAGDGRFANEGEYHEYLGFEINSTRFTGESLPSNANILTACAFSSRIDDADLCIGNPPFVRNQDLPTNWRDYAAKGIFERTGVRVSGLANAWQYFFLLALASTNDEGLCALIIPFEWVYRPSALQLRKFIGEHRWNVFVYRLSDDTFENVLTTATITIVDKKKRDNAWRYFAERADGTFKRLRSPTLSLSGVMDYSEIRDITSKMPHAVRGLSPGNQKALVLTDEDRKKHGLRIGRDVVPCITSLRPIPSGIREMNQDIFQIYYREGRKKCWLIRTDRVPSVYLQQYLDHVPSYMYQTVTCLKRNSWWKFKMPPIPNLLFAQGFTGKFPKTVKNLVNARTVGGVCGIYDVNTTQENRLFQCFEKFDLSQRVVPYANGFLKIEINQINNLIRQHLNIENHDG